MRTRLPARSTLVAALLLLVAVPALAQIAPPRPPLPGGSLSRRSAETAQRHRSAGISAIALAYRAEHRMRYLGAVHDQSGTWFGGEGQLGVGLVTLRVSGVYGKLSGDTSTVNPDRDVRVSAASLGIRLFTWFDVGADVAARRVETRASTVVTRLVGGHAGLAIPLGLDGLAGNATAVYYPATDVTGDEKLSLALSGELGFSYAPPRGSVTMRLSYRFDRYDYSAAALGLARLEQQRSVVVGLGIKLGK